mmetsp:Transcript_24971/g.22152  ORF Transcript_24971/g.22152 Transcript_24971/m.22152 type:complete len:106 (+) Transcript_24971:134-451(+)
MCRTKIKLLKMNVEKESWKYVKDNYKEEIKDRLAIAQEEIKKEQNIQKINIKFGNEYTLLKDFKTTRNGYEIKHNWTIYAKLLNEKIETSSVIKSVEFELDDSYG